MLVAYPPVPVISLTIRTPPPPTVPIGPTRHPTTGQRRGGTSADLILTSLVGLGAGEPTGAERSSARTAMILTWRSPADQAGARGPSAGGSSA